MAASPGCAFATHRSAPSSPLVEKVVGMERRQLSWQRGTCRDQCDQKCMQGSWNLGPIRLRIVYKLPVLPDVLFGFLLGQAQDYLLWMFMARLLRLCPRGSANQRGYRQGCEPNFYPSNSTSAARSINGMGSIQKLQEVGKRIILNFNKFSRPLI